MKKIVEFNDGDMPETTANKTLNKLIDNMFEDDISTTRDETVKFTFTVERWQHDKYLVWVDEQNKKAVEIQKKKIKNPGPEHIMCWEMGYPYCGAIGGEISWEFTPTGLGDCCVVKHSVTGEELNLTDYNSW